MQRMHFGASSERLAGQPDLFDEKVSLPMPPTALESISYERKKSKGRPKLPENLPRTRIDYDLSADEKAEFEKVEKIGEEISETLDFIPAKVTVIEHARAKYRCEKDGESTIRTAFAEPSPLLKSNASAGLLAHILASTFADHLPLNRREGVFKRHGVILPRSTLCEWKLGSGELLYALMPSLIGHVLAAPRIHTDDTTLPLIEGGTSSSHARRRS